MKAVFILLLLFSFSVPAAEQIYHRGSLSCPFSEIEEKYKRNSENLRNQVAYAMCLILKGEDENGLARLYHLADFQGSLIANFFVAEYLNTDGTFEARKKNFHDLDKIIKYYSKTLAMISLIPNYPGLDYRSAEEIFEIELISAYKLPFIYLSKYNVGVVGDYWAHILQSPSYKGDRNKDTYPDYNTFTQHSLEEALRHFDQCLSLPQKRHFDPGRYEATMEACKIFKNLITTLMPMEAERNEILLRPHCEDLNKTNCPEYYESDTKAFNLLEAASDEVRVIFKQKEHNRQVIE